MMSWQTLCPPPPPCVVMNNGCVLLLEIFPFRWVPYGWFPILSLQSPTLKSQAMVHVVEETGLSGWRLLELEKRYFSIATYSGKRSFTFSYNCRKGRFFYGKILESWVFFFLFQPFNSDEWPRQKFSSQYQYKIKKSSDENQEKYQLGDY